MANDGLKSSEDIINELKVALLNEKGESDYWRRRCAIYEAHHERLEQAGAEVRGAVERFLVVLQHARPQGTEKLAGSVKQ